MKNLLVSFPPPAERKGHEIAGYIRVSFGIDPAILLTGVRPLFSSSSSSTTRSSPRHSTSPPRMNNYRQANEYHLRNLRQPRPPRIPSLRIESNRERVGSGCSLIHRESFLSLRVLRPRILSYHSSFSSASHNFIPFASCSFWVPPIPHYRSDKPSLLAFFLSPLSAISPSNRYRSPHRLAKAAYLRPFPPLSSPSHTR
jgi:hypothetical protein